MALMIAGIVLWSAAHLFKVLAPDARARLARRAGEGPVKGLMAVLLLASVAMMTVGYQQAAFVNVWFPPVWTVHLNNLLMVLAVGIFIAGGIPGHVRHWVRHPQLIGFKTWALAHLLVNGDLASIVLFGGLLAWGVVSLVGINKRDGKGPKPARGTLRGNLIHAGATVAVFGAISWTHDYFGVWPYPG